MTRRRFARGRSVPTFADAVETVIEIHAAGWKDGGKSAAQWRASLRDYAMPRLGRRRVADISTADVMAVLLPIWNDKRETARRVRQRIGAVMKWAIAEGHRGDNPAGEAIGAALPEERRGPPAPTCAAPCRGRGRARQGSGIGCPPGNRARVRVPGVDGQPFRARSGWPAGMRSSLRQQYGWYPPSA